MATTCSNATCNLSAMRGQKLCSEHNHINALQAEIARISTLIPVDLRTLKSMIGPELENFLSALAGLVVCADPLKASAFGGASVSARLPDKWTGQSMLDERGDNIVTPRGAADSAHARQVLIPRYREKLKYLTEDILSSMNPEYRQPRPKVEKPRCWTRQCKERGKRQGIGQKFCGECGKPFTNIDPELTSHTFLEPVNT